LAAAALVCACANPKTEPSGPRAADEVIAVTTANALIRFNAGQPRTTSPPMALTGLRAGERIVGLDHRVARGELFALGASGQLYRIDPATASARPVGAPRRLPAGGVSWGFDFNPTVDRIRIVDETGVNLRLHPDTGALVQLDSALAYAAGDAHAGKAASVVAAAYTYNKDDPKLTTNYVLDGLQGSLAHQGSKEGVVPAVSPNTGQLTTVGGLGIGRFAQAVFDIADVSNAAYVGTGDAAGATRWHRIDLATGRATFLGTVGGGHRLAGASVIPDGERPQRTTSTGTVVCESTSCVSLPSSRAARPERPCEPMTSRSQPFARAWATIASHGCTPSVVSAWQTTPTAAQASATACTCCVASESCAS
jgi:hypothetical protein